MEKVLKKAEISHEHVFFFKGALSKDCGVKLFRIAPFLTMQNFSCPNNNFI